MRMEVIGNATLYLGDCREILPTLAGIDAVVTDPPYGQRLKTNVITKTLRPGPALRPCHSKPKAPYPDIFGDDAPPDIESLLSAAPLVLVWGAHKFGHLLPPGSFLVWDKVPNGKRRAQGDGEIAWFNGPKLRPVRIKRLLWDGLCVGSEARAECTAGVKRVHPMQKPVVLMRWCMEECGVKPGKLVVDPFMGAGSTGIACVQTQRRFIGIEMVEAYFDIACRRIEAAMKAAAACSR